MRPRARPAPATTRFLGGFAYPSPHPRRRAAQGVAQRHKAWVEKHKDEPTAVLSELALLVGEAAQRLRPRRYARMGSGGDDAKEAAVRTIFAVLLRCARAKPGVLRALMRGAHPAGLLPLYEKRTGAGA